MAKRKKKPLTGGENPPTHSPYGTAAKLSMTNVQRHEIYRRNVRAASQRGGASAAQVAEEMVSMDPGLPGASILEDIAKAQSSSGYVNNYGPARVRSSVRKPRSFMNRLGLESDAVGRGLSAAGIAGKAEESVVTGLPGQGVLRKLGKYGPKAAGIAGGVALPLLLSMGPSLVRGARSTWDQTVGGDQEFDDQLEMEKQIRAVGRIREERERRLQRAQQENTARLMQMNPQMAAELMAGRKLPQMSTVIGGKKRTDLLDEVARKMSTGGYQQQDGGDMGGLLQ